MAETAAKSKPKRQLKTNEGAPIETFFKKVSGVAKEDWGARALLYVYRMEPMVDRLRSGEKKYIMRYEEPVSEERLLNDHGSGRYKLVLNFRKPGAETGDELDSAYVEIMNPNFPPKVPFGEWLEDSRNKKWLWAKPILEKQAQQQGTMPGQTSQAGSFVDAVRAVNEIRRDALDEQSDPESTVLNTIKVVKELMPQAPAGPSMLDTIKAVKEVLPQPQPATENTVLQTVVTLMTSQLEAQRAEARELRQEIRDMRTKTNGVTWLKEGLGTLKEFGVEPKELLSGLRGRITRVLGTDDGGGGLGRSRMNGWQEFFQPIVSDIFTGPLAAGLSNYLTVKAQMAATAALNPQPNNSIGGAAPQPVRTNPSIPAAQQPRDLVGFFNMVYPQMLRYLKEDWAGDEFTEWLIDGYGCPYEGLDWLNMARLAGRDQIVTAFRASPFWPQISGLPNGEAKFIEFVQSFLSYNPNEAGDDGADDGVSDLTEEEIHPHV